MRMRVRFVWAAVCCLLALGFSSSAWSASEQSVATQDTGYWQLSGKKLLRGIHNTALGWLELPIGIRDAGSQHGAGAAATWGVIDGIGKAIQRTAVGVFEVVTFPVGVPENFQPIIDSNIGQTGLKHQPNSASQ